MEGILKFTARWEGESGRCDEEYDADVVLEVKGNVCMVKSIEPTYDEQIRLRNLHF